MCYLAVISSQGDLAKCNTVTPAVFISCADLENVFTVTDIQLKGGRRW